MADSILRLKVESQEYDAKLKRAADGLNRYVENCRKVGGTLEYVEKETLDFVRAIGQMDATAKTATGKLAEMKTTFTEFGMMYKRMTDAEKASPVGKALSQSLDELKVRIQQTKNDMQSLEREMSGAKFGQFGGIINDMGKKMGINANITELLTSKTAMLTAGIGAATAVIGKATQEWAKYNAELSKQDQITTITTGLQGPGADHMTDQARALVDTYNVDFREAIKAANTLMSQFGESGESAMQIIRDGMRGMIQGNGGKLLSMIQQYAPAFRDAGISASQLVAVIQNSEGGIFTEQNMNAIVMGIKNIRLMTESTATALAKLGVDGDQMTQQLNAGTMSIFEALQKVSNAINNTESAGQAAGEVMQRVFGKQGAAAGTKLGEAIATLNTNLEETKKQTGDLGESFDELYEANVRLNTALREAFGYDGWEQMANGIRSKLIGALSDVIEHLAIIEEGFAKIKNFFSGWGSGNSNSGGVGYSDIKRTQQWINNGKDDDERRRRYDKAMADLQNKLNNVGKEYSVRNADGSTSFKIDDAETQARKRAALETRMSMLYATSFTPKPETFTPIHTPKGGKTTPKLTDAQQADADVQKALKDYADAISNAQQKMVANMITSDDYDKQVQQGQQRLADAYLKAYNVTGDEQYLDGFRTASSRYNEMSDVIKDNIEAQREQQQAARELAATQKKVSDAMAEAQTAYQNNDLKGYLASMKKAGADASQGMTAQQAKNITATVTIDADNAEALQKLQEVEGVTIDPKTVKVNYEDGGFTLTTSNLDAFIGNLKEKISQSDVGSEPYNKLTKQLADANALSSVIEFAKQNGIDTAQFDPQGLFKKIFSEGADIKDDFWKNLTNGMGKQAGKKFEIDPKTGKRKEGKDGKDGKDKDFVDVAGKLNSGITSMVGSLEQMGVDIPEGFKGVLGGISGAIGVLQSIMMIVQAIEAMQQVGTFLGIFHKGGVVHAAGGVSIVPGNRPSGDTVPALLESGEVVLNRAQVNNLSSILENGGGIQNLRLEAVVTGEQIRMALNNNGRRTGRGEYVQSNRR